MLEQSKYFKTQQSKYSFQKTQQQHNKKSVVAVAKRQRHGSLVSLLLAPSALQACLKGAMVGAETGGALFSPRGAASSLVWFLTVSSKEQRQLYLTALPEGLPRPGPDLSSTLCFLPTGFLPLTLSTFSRSPQFRSLGFLTDT